MTTPEGDRLADASARAERIGELRAELAKLVAQRVQDVLALHEDGKSERQISAICGLSPVRVHRIIRPQVHRIIRPKPKEGL